MDVTMEDGDNIRRLNENLRIYKGAVVSLLVQEDGDMGSFLIDRRHFKD